MRHGRVDEGRDGRMLLLHGLANNSGVWSRLVAQDRGLLGEIWTADLPWRSDGPPDWGHSLDLLSPVREALTAVPGGFDVVVAHSFTSNVVLRLLTEDAGRDLREQIRGLVLVAPFYRGAPAEFRGDTVPALYDDFVRVMREGIAVQARPGTAPDMVHAMAERVCDQVGPYGWLRVSDTYLRTPWLRLDGLGMPVLVVAGGRDHSAPESERLAGALPSGSLAVSARCGHFPMLEDVDWFAGVLRSHLMSVVLASPCPTGAA
ncbi:alpha/beta hydrolase [Micromonospora sp. WMMD1120]|uniref:alpha/beta fold hydrolase n=1 Tax=Micromonospora sp. WMMD1120 TaxID=3016106 RepID=UPI002417021D|nr:alpha/beta hydrolase [Micromonospora sp. WMMD1120]MDG4810809.1 alpha/beta hydrolase [Micromonospora sp. WMMD1120]